jgi:hypothetical protein
MMLTVPSLAELSVLELPGRQSSLCKNLARKAKSSSDDPATSLLVSEILRMLFGSRGLNQRSISAGSLGP